MPGENATTDHAPAGLGGPTGAATNTEQQATPKTEIHRGTLYIPTKARRIYYTDEHGKRRRLTRNAVDIAFVLARFENMPGNGIYPRHETIAGDRDIDEKTVRRSLIALRCAGVVTWRRNGLGRPNTYRLNLKPLFESPESAHSVPGKMSIPERTFYPNQSNTVPESRNQREGEEPSPSEAASPEPEPGEIAETFNRRRETPILSALPPWTRDTIRRSGATTAEIAEAGVVHNEPGEYHPYSPTWRSVERNWTVLLCRARLRLKARRDYEQRRSQAPPKPPAPPPELDPELDRPFEPGTNPARWNPHAGKLESTA
jgi:hypothetical protein